MANQLGIHFSRRGLPLRRRRRRHWCKPPACPARPIRQQAPTSIHRSGQQASTSPPLAGATKASSRTPWEPVQNKCAQSSASSLERVSLGRLLFCERRVMSAGSGLASCPIGFADANRIHYFKMKPQHLRASPATSAPRRPPINELRNLNSRLCLSLDRQQSTHLCGVSRTAMHEPNKKTTCQ